jgi:hypothetical protein
MVIFRHAILLTLPILVGYVKNRTDANLDGLDIKLV